jgi:chorismate-pyruvate lyase
MNTILNNPSLNLFQKVLLATDGSVTELLSLYTRRNITARKIEQVVGPDNPPSALPCSAETPLLRRKVMLTDSDSQTNYVFAQSTFILDRLSESTQHKLLKTETPIGLIWKEEKSEMFREIIDICIEKCADTSSLFDMPADTDLLSRTYLLYQSSVPFGMITEKFPLNSFEQ